VIWPFKSKRLADKPPDLVSHHDHGAKAAVVFIHGFSGNSEATWGQFPGLLAAEPRLREWDIFSLGYYTNLRLDIPGIWRAKPDLQRLAVLLSTMAAYGALGKRDILAFIAHSMGGLVVQKALVRDAALADRVSHVVLFGTPSAGLEKAQLGRLLNRQVRDMAAGGPFIAGLRKEWTETFSPPAGWAAPFRFLAVAGDRDDFVAAESSIEPFPSDQQAVVYGDHLEIVKPRDASALSVSVVCNVLAGQGAPAGPWNSARIALERRDFQQAIDALWPHRDELDEQHAVTLALALESVARSADAIEVLEQHLSAGTDVLGTLAGRLKRRWLAEGRLKDADRAEELYRQGLARAEADGNASQAYYHAINVAFLELARRSNRKAAQELAERALEHCGSASEDHWNLATQGEACLILGKGEEALERYRLALGKGPSPRQIESMFSQSVRVAELLGDRGSARRLEGLFRGEAIPEPPPG
jgi:pimeloyl-ACP methyl ester carboxylesterase